MEKRFTKAPYRYNPSTVLKKMEKKEIGTKSTRARIIQTLYDRKYISGKKILVTDLGFEVVNVLERYCPSVVSTRLTQELEEKMNKIQFSKEKRQNVVKEAVENLKLVVEKLRAKERKIGEQISAALESSRLKL